MKISPYRAYGYDFLTQGGKERIGNCTQMKTQEIDRMKKKILTLLLLVAFTFGLSGVTLHSIAEAADFSPLFQIEITQLPSKTTYMSGEELDFSDMIVTGSYADGTKRAITDYQIEGYDKNKLGTQMIRIIYQGFNTNFFITVVPAKVTNITVADLDTTSKTMTWDAVPGAYLYEIYRKDELTGSFNYYSSSASNSVTLYDTTGLVLTFQIRAVGVADGIGYWGDFSDPFIIAAPPEAVTGLTITGTTATSISLSWNEIPGATGYLIYRAPATKGSFMEIGTVTQTGYIDNTLASGTGYIYKVCAYIVDKKYSGKFSMEVSTSTNPARVALRYKAGEQKVRLTWAKVTGATAYDIYIGDDITGFTLLTTNTGNTNCTYIAEGLTTGNSYSFYAIARREYNGSYYDSLPSDKIMILIAALEATSTTAKFFPNQTDFETSMAYTKLEFFRNNVDFTRSFIIPGLITTNVGGFSSTRMCPQGITFAGDYLLLTAYDQASEENSVIYVMDKVTQSLITTLILPVKAHAGGISFDGTDVWVAVGTKVSSIPFTDIQAAANAGGAYNFISFKTTSELGITASYMTYYDDKLWVGSYNELKTTKMYSYLLHKEGDTTTLEKQDIITMPTRVQGITFTEDGYLILSRSCQLYQGLRGYMRQIDVYQPKFAEKKKSTIPLGDIVNTVEMPSMNEEIALDGGYLYVNFESGAFSNASYTVDRICAFDLNTILAKPLEEK